MKIWLQIASGDQAGKRFEIGPGQPARIGRDQPCEIRISGDSLLSNPHCAIAMTSDGARLRDLGSKFGTFHNGRKVEEAALMNGDVVRAGNTEFEVALEADAQEQAAGAKEPEAPDPDAYGFADTAVGAPTPHKGSLRPTLLSHLARQRGLFALLDAAREMTVPYRLQEAKIPHESLYVGVEGLRQQHFGPWLAEVQPASAFLNDLVNEGWGKSWGVYLVCPRSLKDVRHHLRRFIMVGLPGSVAYFRFYDPRVLRIYLPTCLPEESAEFFGPIESYMMENEEGTNLLTFAARRREPTALAVGG